MIQGLPYLDMVVHETLRMYSPVPFNNREATVDYHIPGTEVRSAFFIVVADFGSLPQVGP